MGSNLGPLSYASMEMLITSVPAIGPKRIKLITTWSDRRVVQRSAHKQGSRVRGAGSSPVISIAVFFFHLIFCDLACVRAVKLKFSR